MLRGGERRHQQSASRSQNLLVFSAGGRRLAVKTTDVVNIAPWRDSVSVASQTPYVSAVVRYDQVVLPVFALAELLHVRIQGGNPLCLTVKHPLGNLAICIDQEMPILHALDPTNLRAYHGQDVPTDECYMSDFDEIPILSVSRLAMIQGDPMTHQESGKG